MRRLVVACLLAVFAILATADAFACPDGCQSARSASAADRCNDSGQCVFCTGAVVVHAPQLMLEPISEALPTKDVQDPQASFPPVTVPDRPPRLT
jgi:hypothetical protein